MMGGQLSLDPSQAPARGWTVDVFGQVFSWALCPLQGNEGA